MKTSKHNNFTRSNVKVFNMDEIRKDVFRNLGMTPKEPNQTEKKIQIKGPSTVIKSVKNNKTSKFQKK